MKKHLTYFLAATLSLATPVITYGSTTTSNTTTIPTETKTETAKALVLRLNEIKAMDKSQLSVTEKKELRREVKGIRGQLKDSGDGIYISVGAVIIILLLLILLL